MTLNRLLIILVVLMALAGGGIVWLWQYAYTPQGRARTILTQLRRDTTSLRGWMIKHKLIKREITIQPYELNPPKDTKPEPVQLTPEMIESMEGDEEIQSLLHFDERAAKKWAQIGPEAVPVVLEALDDPQQFVQIAAVQGLAKIGSSQAVQALLKKASSGDSDSRFECFEALDKCRSLQAVPGFVEGLHSANREVRFYCVRALGEIRSPEAVEPLIAAMHDQHSNESLESHASSNDSFESIAAYSLDCCADSSSVPLLIGAIEDKEASVRTAALTSLLRLKDKRATVPLAAFLAKGDDFEVEMVLKVLYETKDARTAAGLRGALKRGSISNRIAAAGILVRLDRKEGLDFLVGLITNEDAYRIAAMRELTDSVMMHQPALQSVVNLMLPLANDSDWQIREALANMMLDLRAVSAVGVLRKMQKDPQEEVRQAAADALEMIEVDHPGSTAQTAPVGK